MISAKKIFTRECVVVIYYETEIVVFGITISTNDKKNGLKKQISLYVFKIYVVQYINCSFKYLILNSSHHIIFCAYIFEIHEDTYVNFRI